MLQTRIGLKAVFNLGAGVDALSALRRDHPDLLPPHVLLIKLEDAGMGIQMCRYVGYAVLRHFLRCDEYARLQKTHTWKVLPPRIQSGYQIGVMGLGALGAQVAVSLFAMGFPVRGWSRSVKSLQGVSTFHGRTALPAFADGLHVLVNMLPLTVETDNILDYQLFEKLAHGAYLVNAARGAHVVEADLLTALANGRLSGATLDVFRDEPLGPDHPFWREPRIEITPHVSAITERTESVRQITEKIVAIEKGEPVTGVVDLERGY